MHRHNFFHPDVDDVREGIQEELEDTPEFFEFVVEDRVQHGKIWMLSVDVTQTLRADVLDESLEGAAAWWAGPPKGGADVLAVIPEDQQIALRFATSPPPKSGKIRIYPPRYLEALLQRWENREWAARCLTWVDTLRHANTFTKDKALDPSAFPWLRALQAASFQLPGWTSGFLWGPPGTGKTTTLGAMLAQYMIQFPRARILLLSTTNSATDIALVSVDNALQELASQSPAAARARTGCFRIGNHFIANKYKGREHLLPVQDERLIRRLADLEAKRPDKEAIARYALWKQQVEEVRGQIRQQAARILQEAKLAAMTTTRAVFTFAELYQLSPYDLVVFDEASQVGLAHAVAIAPLARSALFAGDPQQLSPIVRSERRLAQAWLGESMFVYMKKEDDSTCLLTEQSRMAEPICNVVSQLFYKGELTVAEKNRQDPLWIKARTPPAIPPLGSNHVSLHLIEENGTWSQKWRGLIRYRSAEAIQNLVTELIKQNSPEDILILTPFRAQRALIRAFLRKAGYKRITVNTVHRAQGSEQHTVIFDPVQGESQFLQNENARRLINVALSRAQARLVIILSPADRKNPVFDRICNIVEHQHVPREGISLAQLVASPDFPEDALERIVQIDNVIGRVVHVDTRASRLTLMDLHAGKTRKYDYDTPKVRKIPAASPEQHITHPIGIASSQSSVPSNGFREITRFQEKALKIIAHPKRHYWTPQERVKVREYLGCAGLGDKELAHKFVNSLTTRR